MGADPGFQKWDRGTGVTVNHWRTLAQYPLTLLLYKVEFPPKMGVLTTLPPCMDPHMTMTVFVITIRSEYLIMVRNMTDSQSVYNKLSIQRHV